MYKLGIDVGGTNLKAGLVNDEGSILAMEKRKIAEVSDQKALVEALVALGYTNAEAVKAVKSANVTEEMDSEAVLKASLKYLAFL